jgi:hypothetical protein
MPESLIDPKVGRSKRIWGIVLMVLGVVSLIGSIDDFDPGGLMWVVLLAVGGWLLYRAAAKEAERATREALGRLQLEVLALAREDGRLTVTEVASRLHWPMDRAATVLDSLDDGLRICSTLSDAGVMVYEFRELIHDPDRPQLPASPPPLPRRGRGRGQ